MIRAGDEKAIVDDKGNPIARPYTPISASEKPGEVEFLIKKYDTGKVTPYLHNMKVSPFGVLDNNRVLMLASFLARRENQHQRPVPQALMEE
jgi:hypothetical protein